MDKTRIELTIEWNKFKEGFYKLCDSHPDLKEKIDKNIVYHFNDKDDPKKLQVILAFMGTPFNVFRTPDGGLKVETQWGCRLIYTLQYNGSVICTIKGYDDSTHKITIYNSASKITERRFKRHVDRFFLVEHCTSQEKQPRAIQRIRFFILRNLTIENLVKVCFGVIPMIKRIFIGGNKKNDSQ